jgi:hypothetical protein
MKFKKIFSSETAESISTKLAKFGCGGHLGQKDEPPDTFLEKNHPMTISSKFSSY